MYLLFTSPHRVVQNVSEMMLKVKTSREPGRDIMNTFGYTAHHDIDKGCFGSLKVWGRLLEDSRGSLRVQHSFSVQ